MCAWKEEEEEGRGDAAAASRHNKRPLANRSAHAGVLFSSSSNTAPNQQPASDDGFVMTFCDVPQAATEQQQDDMLSPLSLRWTSRQALHLVSGAERPRRLSKACSLPSIPETRSVATEDLREQAPHPLRGPQSRSCPSLFALETPRYAVLPPIQRSSSFSSPSTTRPGTPSSSANSSPGGSRSSSPRPDAMHAALEKAKRSALLRPAQSSTRPQRRRSASEPEKVRPGLLLPIREEGHSTPPLPKQQFETGSFRRALSDESVFDQEQDSSAKQVHQKFKPRPPKSKATASSGRAARGRSSRQ